MKCPKCKNETSVKDSRLQHDNSVRRRRVCLVCTHTLRTREIIITDHHVHQRDAVVIPQRVKRKLKPKPIRPRIETLTDKDVESMTDEELENLIGE